VTIALDRIRSLIQPGETVVAVLTGHGLKNPPSI
jgi:threonine synthase